MKSFTKHIYENRWHISIHATPENIQFVNQIFTNLAVKVYLTDLQVYLILSSYFNHIITKQFEILWNIL